ncbi:hypothetical protein NVI2019_PEGOAJLN_02284 [Providencia alcalifaciens]|uniref:LysR family transcriptional regulator n=1 Tax=Providencia alcalifaciens TaxID=126385 RepID=UPI0004534D9E|nr:LysR family transcriptional regulator [Providencia alcalifaciens]EUD02290.1 hypothetical protein HMPREF1565_1335 [Providencia alcalifaciens RIMD 1656011]CAG9423783.1 hypothetical protein NVI2019_PEGOAJLN_02284 [Providencia alcalifaciens]
MDDLIAALIGHYLPLGLVQQHPQGKMDLVNWLSHPHILVSMKPFDANEIDHQLQLSHQQRRIAVTVPYWQIYNIYASTDLDFQMVWHQRSDANKALEWLRRIIVEQLKDEGELYGENSD